MRPTDVCTRRRIVLVIFVFCWRKHTSYARNIFALLLCTSEVWLRNSICVKIHFLKSSQPDGYWFKASWYFLAWVCIIKISSPETEKIERFKHNGLLWDLGTLFTLTSGLTLPGPGNSLYVEDPLKSSTFSNWRCIKISRAKYRALSTNKQTNKQTKQQTSCSDYWV